MSLVIRHANLIDGTGADPLPDGTIVVEDGRITELGAAADFGVREWTGYEVVEANGRTVLPGLINCHEHFEQRHGYGSFQERNVQPIDWGYMRAVRNALLALQEGITTVRDVGSHGVLNLTLKQAIQERMIIGPRMLTCGQPLCITGGHGAGLAFVADGADAVRRAARTQLHHGADLIKCMASGGYISRSGDRPWSPQYSSDEMRVAFDEAHKVGKSTTVHAHPPIAIRNAVEAGVDCIEHAALIDQATAELLAKQGIPIVPTMVEHWDMADHGLEWGRPKWLVEHSRGDLEQRLEHFRYLVAAGCKVAVGTDVMGTVVREMEVMVMGGLSNMGAILAATRNGAEVCGLLSETGTLERGKWADLILIDGDPMVDLNALRHVDLVVLEGVQHRPAVLAAATGRFPL